MSERVRISSLAGGHWLVFDNDRRITGCHCGFKADMDSDCGWGDSVVDHIYDAGRTAALAPVRAAVDRAENPTRTDMLLRRTTLGWVPLASLRAALPEEETP